MTVRRAVLHYPVALENVHAADNIIAGKQDLVLRQDSGGDGWLVTIDEIGEEPEHGKTEEISQHCSLKPKRRTASILAA